MKLTTEQYADGFNLYSFKITDRPIRNGTAGPRLHAERGSVRLEFDFKTAMVGNLKLIIMYQMLGIIEIDEFNNISVS